MRIVRALEEVAAALERLRQVGDGPTKGDTQATPGDSKPEPPVEGLNLKDQVSLWTDASSRLRDTIKWIAASFGALGALLIGTAPLAGLADVERTASALVLPVLFGGVALTAVATIVWATTELLTPSPVSLVHLGESRDLEDLRTLIAADPTAYLGIWGGNVDEFLANRDREYAIAKELDAWLRKSPDPETYDKLLEAKRKVDRRLVSFGRISARLLVVAEFHDLAARFEQAKLGLFLAAGFTAVGVAGFLMTIDPASPGVATEPTPGQVSLSSEGTARLQSLLGASCPDPFDAIVLSGGVNGPWELLVDDPDCEDGAISLSSQEGDVRLMFTR